jgi:hypothetical protein
MEKIVRASRKRKEILAATVLQPYLRILGRYSAKVIYLLKVTNYFSTPETSCLQYSFYTTLSVGGKCVDLGYLLAKDYS